MSRLSLSWVLSLLLVFAQQGAVLHELGHLSHDTHVGGVALSSQQQPSKSTSCPTCDAFAQLANGAATTAVEVAVCPAAIVPIPAPRYTVIGADAPTARSRGPPQNLN